MFARSDGRRSQRPPRLRRYRCLEGPAKGVPASCRLQALVADRLRLRDPGRARRRARGHHGRRPATRRHGGPPAPGYRLAPGVRQPTQVLVGRESGCATRPGAGRRSRWPSDSPWLLPAARGAPVVPVWLPSPRRPCRSPAATPRSAGAAARWLQHPPARRRWPRSRGRRVRRRRPVGPRLPRRASSPATAERPLLGRHGLAALGRLPDHLARLRFPPTRPRPTPGWRRPLPRRSGSRS